MFHTNSWKPSSRTTQGAPPHLLPRGHERALPPRAGGLLPVRTLVCVPRVHRLHRLARYPRRRRLTVRLAHAAAAVPPARPGALARLAAQRTGHTRGVGGEKVPDVLVHFELQVLLRRLAAHQQLGGGLPEELAAAARSQQGGCAHRLPQHAAGRRPQPTRSVP